MEYIKNETPISYADRRSFLKTVLVAGAAPMVLSSGLLGKDAPSNKITLAACRTYNQNQCESQ